MQIKIIKAIKLSKSLKYGKIKSPVLLNPSDEVLEASDKWEEKFRNFPDHIQIIEDTIDEPIEDTIDEPIEDTIDEPIEDTIDEPLQ